MNTKVLTTHIPLPLAEKVDQIAARLDRSRAWVVKQALSNWVEMEEEHRRMTLQGMADVDAGRVIEHDSMRSWADSLTTDKPLPVPR